MSSNYSGVYNTTTASPIADILLKTPYLIVTYSAYISQIDIDINISISNLSVNATNLRASLLLSEYFALYPERPHNATTINHYQFTRQYPKTSGVACYEGYSYWPWGSACYKNLSYIYTRSRYTWPSYYSAYIANDLATQNTTANTTNTTTNASILNITNTTANTSAISTSSNTTSNTSSNVSSITNSTNATDGTNATNSSNVNGTNSTTFNQPSHEANASLNASQ